MEQTTEHAVRNRIKLNEEHFQTKLVKRCGFSDVCAHWTNHLFLSMRAPTPENQRFLVFKFLQILVVRIERFDMSDSAIPPPLSPASSRATSPVHHELPESFESILGKRSASGDLNHEAKKISVIKSETSSAETQADSSIKPSSSTSSDDVLSNSIDSSTDSSSNSANSFSSHVDRSFKMRAQSCYGYIHNLLNVQRPRLDQPFTSLDNATDRLFVYHVYQHQPEPTERVSSLGKFRFFFFFAVYCSVSTPLEYRTNIIVVMSFAHVLFRCLKQRLNWRKAPSKCCRASFNSTIACNTFSPNVKWRRH
jgi:hypothetical protein